MKNNKLYAAAVLADEIGNISRKTTLATNMMDNIFNGMIDKNSLEKTAPEFIIESYKELLWKTEILSDYLLYIYQQLSALESHVDEYYDGGEKFVTKDIVSLIQEAARGNGKVSGKKMLAVLGNATEISEDSETM